MALMALLALLGTLVPLRFLSALVLLVAFAVSFVAGQGWYFMLTPSPLALAGIGTVLYLISAGLMIAAARPGRELREER